MRQIRFLMRSLVRNPAFSMTSMLTLALGIGGTVAVLSVVDQVLVQPLPYRSADRLVMVWTDNRREGLERYPLSYPDFSDIRERAKSVEGLSAVISFQWDAVLGGPPEPRRVTVQFVSGSLFPMLGVEALRGRTLLPEDDRPQAPPAVLLSQHLWRSRFGADPEIVGKAVELDGRSATVAGVLPAGFRLFGQADLWAPLAHNPNTRRNRRFQHWLRVLGRLAPGATLQQAQTELQSIARVLQQEFPDTNKGLSAWATPLQEEVVAQARPALLVLLGAVFCILLIACANVSSLMTIRASAREAELAIRRFLGGGRLQLAASILAEGLALAAAGALAGLLLDVWVLHLLKASSAAGLPRLNELTIGLRTLGLAAAAVFLATLLCCGPAVLRSWRADPSRSLKGVRYAGGCTERNIQRWIVTGEIAMALMLLISAGLLMRSFINLSRSDLGFLPRNLLVMKLHLPGQTYDSDTKRLAFCRRLLEELQAVPDVAKAAVSRDIPLRGRSSTRLEIEGRSESAEERPEVDFRGVSPDYFRTMGISLLRGRHFSPHPSDAEVRQVIVNRSASRLLWKGEDALGRGLRISGLPENTPWWRVIGIAEDVHHRGAALPPYPEVYFQLQADPPGSPWAVVRTKTDPEGTAGVLRQVLRSLDRDLVVDEIIPMETVVSESLAPNRFNTALLGSFAALAVALAIVGVYGVASHSVQRQREEIGIRAALGGTPSDIMKGALLGGLRWTGLGLALGLLSALGVTRLLEGLLFEVAGTDVWTYAAGTAALLAASFLAHFFPASRASRVDPVLALHRQ